MMSSPSSVFTLPEDYFDHQHDNINDDACYGGPSSSSSSSSSSDADECCHSRSPILFKKNGLPVSSPASTTALSEIDVQSARTRWNQHASPSVRSIVAGDAVVVFFGSLSLNDDDEFDDDDSMSDNDKKKRRNKKKEHNGRSTAIIMPRWLAAALLLTLAVSVIFFTRATWWQSSDDDASTAGPTTSNNSTTSSSSSIKSSKKSSDAEFIATTYRDILLSILKPLTPRRTLLNTSTPQGQAFAWLLESVAQDAGRGVEKEKEDDGSTTRMRRRRNVQHQSDDDVIMSSKRQQVLERYVIVTLDFALHPATTTNATASSWTNNSTTTAVVVPAVARANLPTCQWTGISCSGSDDDDNTVEDDVFVTTLSWPGFNLTGQIPDEMKGLQHLIHLDLAENDLMGTLPSGLFSLQRLKNLYLHQNRLGGSLNVVNNDVVASNKTRLQGFAKLRRLENVYLGNNNFHGPFPTGLNVPGGKLLELRYLSLHQNRLTGPLPEDLHWHKLVYLDLSNNQFNGTLPVDWCQATNVTTERRRRRLLEQQPNNSDTSTMTNNNTTATTVKMTTALPHIHYLFLNHNQFSGTIPVELPSVLGNGRVELLHIGDNNFYGHVPGDYSKSRIFMTSLEVQNNHFTSLDPYICTLSVLTPPDGELVNLRADCPICTCPSLCKAPCPNNTFTSTHHHHHDQNNTESSQNATSASTSAVAATVGGKHY